MMHNAKNPNFGPNFRPPFFFVSFKSSSLILLQAIIMCVCVCVCVCVWFLTLLVVGYCFKLLSYVIS